MSYRTVISDSASTYWLSGPRWATNSVTYSFPIALPDEYLSHLHFSTLNVLQRAAVTNALQLIADVSNLNFKNLGFGGTGDIRIFNVTEVGTALTFQPGANPGGGDSLFNNLDARLVSPKLGNYGHMTFLHEIGHAVGLNHPGSYNGGFPVYERDARYQQDTLQYTVMSYFDAAKTGADHFYTTQQYAETLLLHDILALQSMYGVDKTARTGNTVYGFNSNSGIAAYNFATNRDPVVCIWDAGGNDTLDFSGFSRTTIINLNPGTFSSTDLMHKNVSIMYRAIIENAKGGSGNDTITGNIAANLLWGNAGDDKISAGASNDHLAGGEGNDLLYAGTGNDQLSGGGGNDLLDGSTGNDQMIGGYGDDTYYIDSSADQIVESAAAAGGKDRVYSTVTYTLADSVEELVLLGIQRINGYGNAGNNRIIGNLSSNVIDGGAGDDYLNGGGRVDNPYGGVDSLYGGDGNDTLVSGSFVDLLYGGSGDDTYIIGIVGQIFELAGGGVDTVHATQGNADLSENVENLVVSQAGAYGRGNSLNNVITGLAGSRLYGMGGDDTLVGSMDSDFLDGGSGADRMSGGDGGDSYYVDNVDDVIIESATGSDLDRVLTTVAFTLPENVEHVEAHTISEIIGNQSNNSMRGHILFGLGGNDSLFGGSSGDRLDGGSGNDRLSGDMGNDVLIGGDGSDTFVFNSHIIQSPLGISFVNIDSISDFDISSDAVELSRYYYSAVGASAGALSANAFFIGSAANDADDRIIYDSASGALYYDPDGTGLAQAVQFAVVGANLALTESHFVIV